MHYRHTIQRTALVLACVVVLGGCSTVKGWFSSKEEKAAAKPTELADITTSVDTAAGKATFVDMKGTDSKTGKPARMVAAMVPVGDDTWFYKLTGDDAVVERQKETFTKFIQGVRYP